ncbi:MAG: UDP-2,3-diacylglucosamine diphosphatase, partial [Infirmifilum sp.]
MRIRKVESEVARTLEVELSDDEEAVIISDTHLGLRYRGRELSRSEELADFLENVSRDSRVKLLVLLGDIFEFWSAGVGDIIRSSYDPMKVLAASDKTVVYVAGNHDRIVSHLQLESRRGRGDLYAVPDFLILKAGGKKYLLLHGHQLDTLFTHVKGLWKLQSYVYILTEPLFSLPGPSEWILAAISTLVLASILATVKASTLSEEIILTLAALFLATPLLLLSWRKLQDRLWYGFIQRIAYRMSKSRLRGKSLENLSVSKPLKHLTRMLETLPEIGKIDGVIIGHTHVPELIVENNRVYANPGAWV